MVLCSAALCVFPVDAIPCHSLRSQIGTWVETLVFLLGVSVVGGRLTVHVCVSSSLGYSSAVPESVN